jgi:hypothetical protein
MTTDRTSPPTALPPSPKDKPMHTANTAAPATFDAFGGSRWRSRTACAATVLATVVVSVVGLGLASTPALAVECPNETLRAENNSTQLPECRAYELVSPVFKEAFAPVTYGFTDDGRVAYASNGNIAGNGNGGVGIYAGNSYVAVRSASGWSTTALAPSGPEYVTGSALASALSSDLRSSLWLMARSDQEDGGNDVYVRRPDGVFSRVGSANGASFLSASDDLSHVVFNAGGGTYEYDGTGADQPRLVSVDNAGQRLAPEPACSTQVGSSDTTYHAVSTDGRVIFWTTNGIACAATPHVYARVNGTTTINASASQCTRAPSDPGGACNADSASVFEGANADGTRVYFKTDQQLVNADTDSTTDLYECDIPAGTPAPVGSVNPCPDLHEVSATAGGSGFQGVTRISDDGSRVYFVATGVLASNPDANDASAVAGDDNLYVWQRDAAHPDGQTTFVAKLDPADVGSLWGVDSFLGRYAQATDDGRYLVFATYAALIDHGPQADTDTARDIYRYDAETGALTRLSIGADGAGGNEPGNDAQITPIIYRESTSTTHGPRVAMSDDGQSVVFTTADALAPNDTNGTIDTYLWHAGQVSLISSGKPSVDQFLPAGEGLGSNIDIQAFISPSGHDVYFSTTAQLTSNDVDTTVDLYDARIDGGFDVSTPPACSGDGCQSPPSAAPPSLPPGSSSSAGQDGPPQVTPTFTVGKLTASQLKHVGATGKVSLSVTTNTPGVLSARATTTIARRASSVGSAMRRASRAGTVSLSLTVSKKARAELKRKRKLTVKVLVSQDNVAISRTVSLKLAQPEAAKGGRS